MRIMRNLCRVVQRLSSVTKKLLKQLDANYGTRRYISQHGSPSNYICTKGSQTKPRLSKEVTNAIKAISKSNTAIMKNERTMYLVDEEAAKKFSALIMATCRTNPPYVIEINSGLGFLTKELLEAGIPSINMFEAVPNLIPKLLALVNEYPNRVTLKTINFQHIWNVGYIDWKEDSNKLAKYINDIEIRAWNEDPALQIIGALGNINFARRLTATVIFQNTLAKFGRMLLYLAVPPSVWAHLTCTNEHYHLYRRHTVLFQTLFNYELLGTLPRSAFYPYHRQSKRIKKRPSYRLEMMRKDKRIMNIVRIEPKADLFNDNFTRSDIVHFYYFVHHHLKSRTNRVIPALENWVPGCGRILIAHGFNIYTEFGELTPQEIMNLFILFRSWPEFKQSSFESCMDTFLMRRDEHITFDSNSDNLEEMFQFSLDETQSTDD